MLPDLMSEESKNTLEEQVTFLFLEPHNSNSNNNKLVFVINLNKATSPK